MSGTQAAWRWRILLSPGGGDASSDGAAGQIRA
jgi:hypothetical protein